MVKLKKEKPKVEKEKSKLFVHLDNISYDKVPLDRNNDEELKSYDPYIINRFISMIDMYIPIVNEINKYDVPKETHQRYFRNAIPKKKNFFKYMSKIKETGVFEKECISEYFQCSKKETERYLKVLSEEQVESISNIYKSRN